jgi:hypothetical protein
MPEAKLRMQTPKHNALNDAIFQARCTANALRMISELKKSTAVDVAQWLG